MEAIEDNDNDRGKNGGREEFLGREEAMRGKQRERSEEASVWET